MSSLVVFGVACDDGDGGDGAGGASADAGSGGGSGGGAAGGDTGGGAAGGDTGGGAAGGDTGGGAAGGDTGGGAAGGDTGGGAAGGGDAVLDFTVFIDGEETYSITSCPLNLQQTTGPIPTYTPNGNLAALSTLCAEMYEETGRPRGGKVTLNFAGNADGGATQYEGETGRWEGADMSNNRVRLIAASANAMIVDTWAIMGGHNETGVGFGPNDQTVTDDSYIEIESWDADANRVTGTVDVTLTAPESRDEFARPVDAPVTFRITGDFDIEYTDP